MSKTIGPEVLENWLKMHDSPLLATLEYPVYTDAQIIGEAEYGPCQFLHSLSAPVAGIVQPVLVLRCDYYREYPNIDWSESDADLYTGGSLQDEIVALTSLVLGVRLRAGDVSREFFPGRDPKGHPRSPRHRNVPVLNVKSLYRVPNLPRAVNGTRSIQPPSLLSTIPKLKGSEAHSLVRAARAYQNALWLSEADPELSWLLFVSALETAAVAWSTQTEDPVIKLQTAKPGLCVLLQNAGGSTLLQNTAEAFKDSLGVTRKFLDFTLKFAPPAPEPRPRFLAIGWTPKKLGTLLNKVYSLRSKALHDGRPFPAPMCASPYHHSDWPPDAYSEKPSAPVNVNGLTWLEKDLPILLHTFEHITRGALLNWWKATVNDR